MLYNSSLSINDAEGCYKEQSMRNVDYKNYNNNQKKVMGYMHTYEAKSNVDLQTF